MKSVPRKVRLILYSPLIALEMLTFLIVMPVSRFQKLSMFLMRLLYWLRIGRVTGMLPFFYAIEISTEEDDSFDVIIEEMLDLFPKDLAFRERVGSHYLSEECYEKAIDIYSGVLKDSIKRKHKRLEWHARYKLGRAFSYQEQDSKAVDVMNFPSGVNPKSTDAYWLLSDCLNALEKHDKAKEVLEHGIENIPESWKLHELMGNTYQHLDDGEEAKHHFQISIKLNRDDIVRKKQIQARVYIGDAKYEEAISILSNVLREAIDSDNKDAERETRYRMSGAFTGQGKYAEAAEILNFPDGLNPKYVKAYWALWYYLKEQGKNTEAKEVVEYGLLHNPDSWRLHGLLGWTRDEMGNYDDAMAAFKKALELNPDDEEAKEDIEEWIRENEWRIG
ncbi:tetratricopeptide repeat protein [Candidatus Hydrogenedentota bacterium]